MECIVKRDYKKLRHICRSYNTNIRLIIGAANYTGDTNIVDILYEEEYYNHRYDLCREIAEIGNVNVIRYFYNTYIRLHYDSWQRIKFEQLVYSRHFIFAKQILSPKELNKLSVEMHYNCRINEYYIHFSSLLHMKLLGYNMKVLADNSKLQYTFAKYLIGKITIYDPQMDKYHKAATIIQRWYRGREP